MLLVWLSCGIPAFADMIVGLPPDTNTGNCAPFGCGYVGEYQQVYSHTQFTTPIIITGLEFYDTEFYMGATAMNSGSWIISLSTTAADWNTLSFTYASNIGADNTTVFSGDLARPWTFGDTLQIVFETPFTYDPGKGNLLMDVVASATLFTGPIYFDTNGFNNFHFSGNDYLGQVYCNGCYPSSTGRSGYGLTTGFSTVAANVPEPLSVPILGLLLGGAGLVSRRFWSQ